MLFWRAGSAAGLAVFLFSFPLWAERARPSEQDRWLFIEAWGVFRGDLDATVPGEHGGVYLIERAAEVPPWLEHDAIRVATAPPVTSYLARDLARRGDRGAIPAMRAALEEARSEQSRRALERALVRLGDRELRRQMARRLRAASSAERWRAAETLAAAGDEAAPDLRAALEDPDGQTRLVAATALAARGDRRAKGLLVRLLSSTNPFEQVEAAHGLALAGEARGVPVLRQILAEPGPGRARAARSLGRVGGAPDRRLLLEQLRSLPRHRSIALRRALTTAAGQITVRLSLPGVGRYLDGLEDREDDEHGPRAEALAAIGRAAATGALERPVIAARVAAELDSTLQGETPVAAARRGELLRPVSELLAGRAAGAPTTAAPPYSLPRAKRALAQRGGDARARIDRFVAAVQLLEHLGESLGHPARAEAPTARATGLGAKRAIDGNPQTAWIAGPMAGALRIELESPRRLRTLQLMGGCVDRRESYRAHARVREVRVHLDGGAPITGRLADGDPYFQAVDLGGTTARRVELEVTATYPGGRRDAPACIAELRLE